MSLAYFYSVATQALPAGQIDWDAHTIKAMLVGASYVFDQDAHDTMAEITGEIAATGYTAGGVALTGKTNTRTANVSVLDSVDPTWTTPDMAGVYGLVLYDSTASLPILYVNFEGPFGQVSGTFTYPVPAEGWATITAQNAP